MSKKTLSFIVLVLVVAGIFFLTRRSANAPATTSPSAEITPSISATPVSAPFRSQSITGSSPSPKPSSSPVVSATTIFTITRLGSKLSANNLTIKTGDIVKFVNKDSDPFWPASGIHPTHQICPGFDSLRGLNKEESYSFTFNTAKTCPFHDHLDARNSDLLGKIVVELK